MEASRGTLSFFRDARLLSGEIRSPYLDFATDSNPSDIRFHEDTTFGAVELVLGNGGKVTLAGTSFDGDLFTLEATLTARGDGLVEMTGGTLVPKAGITNTGFNCPDETGFKLTAGTVGALGESLANVGNFEQRGGEILGTFTNGGTQILSGSGFNPSIDANFTNTGNFTWNRGSIAGNFSNGTAVTPEAGEMDVEPNASARELEPATTFVNWNLLRQKASIRSDTGVVVQQNGGVLTMSNTAGFPASRVRTATASK